MNEVAAIITAVGVAFGAIGAGLAALVQAVKTSQRVKEIDHAVNGKRDGAMTMVDQVSEMHAEADAGREPLTTSVSRMTERLDELVKHLKAGDG